MSNKYHYFLCSIRIITCTVPNRSSNSALCCLHTWRSCSLPSTSSFMRCSSSVAPFTLGVRIITRHHMHPITRHQARIITHSAHGHTITCRPCVQSLHAITCHHAQFGVHTRRSHSVFTFGAHIRCSCEIWCSRLALTFGVHMPLLSGLTWWLHHDDILTCQMQDISPTPNTHEKRNNKKNSMRGLRQKFGHEKRETREDERT